MIVVLVNSYILCLYLVIVVFYFIGIPCIYIFKCINAKENWKKIIPPIITMVISVLLILIYVIQIVTPYYTLDRNTGSMVENYLVSKLVDFDKLPFELIELFMFYNIPTWIMLSAYFFNYRKKKNKKNINKMRIQDLK